MIDVRGQLIKRAQEESQKLCEHCKGTVFHCTEEHEKEYFPEWVRKMTTEYRQQRDALLKEISTRKDLRGQGHLSLELRLGLQSKALDNGCVVLLKKPTTSGHPQIKVNGRLLTAARYIYETYNGALPGDLQVIHTCDDKRCINPQHLEAVTVQEQVRRSIAAGKRPQNDKS